MTVSAIATMTDVLPFLGMHQAPSDGGALLQSYIDGLTKVVEDIVGHVLPVAFDEFYDGGDSQIFLRHLPVLTVASVTETIGIINYTLTSQPVGHPVDNFGYSLDDPKFGKIVRRSAGSSPFPFFANVGNVEVVYTAGRATVEPHIKLGLLELIRHNWQFGHQAFGGASSFVPAGKGDEDSTDSGPPEYLVPERVKEILQPDLRPVAFS